MPAYPIFSEDYFEAQQRFIELARQLEYDVEIIPHPTFKSPDGPVHMTVATQGGANCERVIFVTSGVHGTELTAGSGIQLDLMQRYMCEVPADTKLVWVHAVNPAGCAIFTRTDENNVDNNRNSIVFGEKLPQNPDYEELHSAICALDIEADGWDKANAAIKAYTDKNGASALTQKVLKGQYTVPMGLFYGGDKTSWSTRTLQQVIARYGHGAKQAMIIDLHTGFGPCGFCEVMDLSASPSEGAEWGLIGGYMCDTIDILDLEQPPTKLILEFGTIPFEQVLDAHRRDNWLKRNQSSVDPEVAQQIRQELKDALFVNTPQWCEALLVQSRDVFEKYVLKN
ncbi:hypothetical protein PsAD2_02933 [Pseudovibrio axinellae]|uniref:DUF2817 domain-containing protein n=1 Tax=Pseudovibrio axinellae TaxID=989403 RepID=A0A165XLD7_9HYPH|nr:DUF2817 domain-containing protein [Pseudovibrio axinellae]KZL17815.1 hypothetical protein PsAD2_02933 [Pseudovibrio axinellae]SEP71321.1 Protein of unknown function [Pseudovibrio axinellae]